MKGKMLTAFMKAQGMDEFLYSIGDINSMPWVQLSPKFKIGDA
jgi:hypothetical protein